MMAVYLLWFKKKEIERKEMDLCDNLTYVGLAFMTLGMLTGAICYRMTTDFERMGDEIRNAAKGVRKLSELVKPLSEPALANVSTLFSLHALLRVMGDDMIACVRLLDPERARALVARRTIVSAEVDEALSDTVERLKTGELKLADGLEFIRINRSLERVAAHMQNVGETVVFMTEGVDIRHAGKTQPQQN